MSSRMFPTFFRAPAVRVSPRSSLVASWLLLVLSCWSGAETPADEGAPKERPAIVRLRVFAADGGSASKPVQPVATCLGFIIEADGMILTSYDPLVDPATGGLRAAIEAELVDAKAEAAKPVPASIVAVEPTLNFAILKIDGKGEFRVSRICPREDIVVGLGVHAQSGMKNGAPVFSHGSITDLNSMECYQESMTATMLRARIEIPDDSIGGPVFNDKGEVVALHSGYRPSASEGEDAQHGETAADEGKIHLLPIFLIFNIYESVKLKGNMKSPWSGFSVRSLTDAELSIFPQGKFLGGVGVDHVWEAGPAEKLGVRKGDLLVGFSYYPTKTVAAFQKWLYMYGVGFKVKLHFIRDLKEYYAVDYTIEERPGWARPR